MKRIVTIKKITVIFMVLFMIFNFIACKPPSSPIAPLPTKSAITYVGVEDSEHTNPSVYTEGEGVVFTDASRAGYTFDGWFSDSNHSVIITKISASTKGAQTVYAKFSVIQQNDEAEYTLYAYLQNENGEDIAVDNLNEARKTEIFITVSGIVDTDTYLSAYALKANGSKTTLFESTKIDFENGVYIGTHTLAAHENTNSIEIELKDKKGDALTKTFEFRNYVFNRTFLNEITIDTAKVDEVGEGESAIRQFPFVFKFGDTLIVSFSQHEDSAVDHAEDAVMVSYDNGATWPIKHVNPDMYFAQMVQLGDGTLWGLNYTAYYQDDHTAWSVAWKSTDDGLTWTSEEVYFHTPPEVIVHASSPHWEIPGQFADRASIAAHRTMMLMDDGSIQGVMYGTNKGDTDLSCWWVKSEDGGKNFYFVSLIAEKYNEKHNNGGSANGFCEPVAVRCKDGSLLVVMRTGNFEPLFYSRSLDDGKTWSEAAVLAGFENQNEELIWSVDPELTLMSNGALILTYGRPSVKMLVSLDGSGYSWSEFYNFNLPVTSGYTGTVEVEPNKLLVIGDYGTSITHHGNPSARYTIWGKYYNIEYQPYGSSLPDYAAVTSDKVVIAKGETANIRLGIYDAMGIPMNISGEVVYVSSNPDIAAVENNGVVTALGDGETDITAMCTFNGRTVTTKIPLKLYCGNALELDSVEAAADSAVLTVGAQTSVSFIPKNLAGSALSFERIAATYASSNKSIAEVSKNGIVTALKKGEVIITVTVVQNDTTTRMATADITVQEEQLLNYNNNFDAAYSAIFKDTFEGTEFVDNAGKYTVKSPEEVFVSTAQKKSGTNSLYIKNLNGSGNLAFATRDFGSNIAPSNIKASFSVYPEVSNAGFAIDLLRVNTTASRLNIDAAGKVRYFTGSVFVELFDGASLVNTGEWTVFEWSLDLTANTATITVNGQTSLPYPCKATTYSTADSIKFHTGSGWSQNSFYVDDVEVSMLGDMSTLSDIDANLAAFSAARKFAGTSSLYVNDNSSGAMAYAGVEFGSSSYFVVDFKLYPTAIANAITIQPRNGTGADKWQYIVRVSSDGAVATYNGNTYDVRLPAGTVKMNEWNTFKLIFNVSDGTVDIYANNKMVTGILCKRVGQNTLAVNRLYFSSGSTVGTGDSFYVDNLSISNTLSENFDELSDLTDYTITGSTALTTVKASSGTQSVYVNGTFTEVFTASGAKRVKANIYRSSDAESTFVFTNSDGMVMTVKISVGGTLYYKVPSEIQWRELGLTLPTGGWHTLEIRYNSVTGVILAFVDGINSIPVYTGDDMKAMTAFTVTSSDLYIDDMVVDNNSLQRNIIKDGGFEGAAESRWSGEGATVSSTKSAVRSGVGAMSVLSTDAYGYAAQDVELAGGVTYYVSAWVRLSTGSQREIYISCMHNTESGINYGAIASKTINSGEWVKIEGTITLAEDATDFKMYVQAYNQSDFNQVLYVDDFYCTAI